MLAKHFLAGAAVAATASISAGLIAAPARATTGDSFETLGEQGGLLACFYECKSTRDGQWREVTVLVLANQRNEANPVTIQFFDGNQNLVSELKTILTGEDLEEINVCRFLDQGAAPVPEAGLIKVFGFTVFEAIIIPSPGIYGWVKNVLGSIRRDLDDPFQGFVRDVAKTQCRVVPPSVVSPPIPVDSGPVDSGPAG